MMRCAMATLALLAMAAAAHAQVEPTAGGLLGRCEGLVLGVPAVGQGAVGVDLAGRAATAGRALTLTDGRSGAELPVPVLSDPRVAPDGSAGVTRWQTEGLSGELGMVARPDALELSVTVANPGPEQRWLTLTLALPVPLDEGWSAWDGATETPAVSAPAYSSGISKVFPMACAYDSARGLALGLQPQMMVSAISLGADPASPCPLFVWVRLVVDAGEAESVGFVVYPFTPRFGWRDALERYYRLYPEWFTPREGTDPQLWGTGGYLGSGGSPLCWEEARRFRFGWDWGYAPYRFTGDWYAHPEYYDGAFGDLDAWHEKMRREVEVEGRAAVALSYIIPQFVNADLAREHFPDALPRDASGRVVVSEGSWVKQDEVITPGYIWGTSMQELSLRGLTELAEKRGAEGISFDNAAGTGMRYGPGPENSPGRAFTPGANGAVWAAEGISYAGHMDHVHSLSNGEHRLMVAANGPRCLLTCFRTDVAMHEAAPWHDTDSLQAMRRLLGHKPIICWEDHPEKELLWEQMSPEELRLALRRDFEFWVMYGLWQGITPAAHRVRGNLILQRHLDELLAVQRAGWWPVPAMRADDDLWLGRFGEGTGTILTLGNATGADVNAEVEVLTRYLGPGCWGLVPFDGAPGLTVANDDGSARLSLPIANRTTAVLRAALQVEGADDLTVTFAGLTGPEGEPLAGMEPDTVSTLTWRLQSPQATPVTIRAWLPDEGRVMRVTLGGREIDATGLDGLAEAPGQLPEGASDLAIMFQPRITVENRAWIDDFSFLADGRPACQIALMQPDDPGVRAAAERLSLYFEYWTAAQIRPGATPSTLATVEERARIPIVAFHGGRDPDLPTIMLAIGPAYNETDGHVNAYRREADGRVPMLEVVGEDGAALEEAVLALLDVLDERYPYAGTLYPYAKTLGAAGPLYEKAGVGATLE